MYLLSFLQCAKYTVVCDQIANKSFALLNASLLGEYRKKPSLRSPSHARRQDSMAWGGGTKNLILRIREGGPKKVFISKYTRIFTNSGVKAKKALRLKKCANFHELRGETAKKGSLLQNLQKKTVLAHEVWGDNQYLGSLRPRTALQSTEPVTFFGAQSSLGGHNSCLGGTCSDLGGGTVPECPRGVGPAASLQHFIEL